MAKFFGADVGYGTVRVVVLGEEGVYRSESAVIAISIADGSAVACGDEAVEISERIPGSVTLVRPFSGEMTPEPQYITAYFSHIVKRMKLKGATLALSLSGAHDEETESVYVKAVQKAGVGAVSIVDPVYAAARGCGVSGAASSAVVNIGASVTDMGCFVNGEQVASRSNSFAGNAFDRAISTSIIKNHRYRPSENEAERIKKELATLSEPTDKTYTARVIRPALGLPKNLTLTSKEVSAACEGVFDDLSDEISDMIRGVRPEPDKLILTGGGANLSGLAASLSPLLLIPIEVAERPELSVIRGLEVILPDLKSK